MVGPNKILTVSYGTFSCTLEGFDDPFSTMRGIAEYFRDLAADDRYFGAEPPTPDAEMLQRIAEKEIQRRVETRMESGGLILRQAEEDQPQIAHDAVDEPVARDHEDASSDEGGAPRPFVQAKAGSGQQSVHTQTETVAEKLARIRAVVNQKSDEYEEADAIRGDDSFAEHSDASEFGTEDADDVPASEVESDIEDDAVEDLVASATDESADADIAEESVAEEDGVEAADETETPTDQAAETEAAEEPAEFATDEEDAPGSEFEDGSDENELHAAEDSAEVEDPTEGVIAAAEEDAFDASNVLAVLTDDDMESDDAGMSGDEEEADSFAALIAEENEAADLEEAEAQDAEPADLEGETVSRLLKMRLNDFQASAQARESFADTYVEDASEAMIAEGSEAGDVAAEEEMISDAETETEAAEAEAEEDPLADVIDSSLSDEDEADLMASLAAVVNDGRDEADEIVPAGTDDSAEDGEQPDDGAIVLTADTQVVDEDEETSEEVAAQATDEDDAKDESEEVEAEAQPERPVSRPEGLKVSRLIEQTNSELAESESTRRRSAIAHLKAAVAATRAERAATQDTSTKSVEQPEPEADDISAYRDDLARVVRPRRPDEGIRNMSRRLPPLVLVSEQRVDLDVVQMEEAADHGDDHAIRPRRIRSEELPVDEDAAENIFSESGSFSEFAREMGATDLPDLLEAAAAYYHYVEGQPHFSRPQIMNAVAAMNDAGEFSREEGLRSFGILLRRGTIRKISRGQFEITDDTKYRPELRAGE